MVDLSGTYLAVPTPFTRRTGAPDLTGFQSNLEMWLDDPIAGVLVGGSTGESVLLDPDERLALVRAAREVAAPTGRLTISGVGAESTRQAVRGVEAVAEAGADLALLSPPAFYRGAMSASALLNHYRRVAGACPVPLLVYQVPLRLGTIEFPTEVIAELSSLSNVVGVKDSRGSLDAVAALLRACDDDFGVLVGSGAILRASLGMGAAGGIVAVGSLAPAPAGRLPHAFREGRLGEADRLQEVIGPLHDRVVAAMGVPGIKAALDLMGMVGGSPRAPLAPLPASRMDELAAALADAASANGVPASARSPVRSRPGGSHS